MDLSTMDSLFAHEIQDLYAAETQIVEALPNMVSEAASQELQSAFQEHLTVTEIQIKRLQAVMRQLDIMPDSAVCEGMKGLLAEGKHIVEADGDPAVKDAALIGSAQRIEHYEIAAYGTVREFARELGYEDIARSLDMTLHEEGDADKELSRIARGTFSETGINEIALR